MHPILSSREIRLLPLYVHHSHLHSERLLTERDAGFAVYSQLTLCFHGEGMFVDSNKTQHPVIPGDVFYFRAAEPHSYYPTHGDWRVIYILFGGNAADEIMDYYSFSKSGVIRSKDAETYENIYSRFSEISELSNQRTADHAQLSCMLYELLSELGSSIQKEHGYFFDKARAQLEPCVNFMRDNFNRDISMSEISSNAGITPNYMNSLFKTVYNTSPQSYLTNIRISYARGILEYDHSIRLRELAHMSGFNSCSYFCRIFKKYTGLTPNEYRGYHSEIDVPRKIF